MIPTIRTVVPIILFTLQYLIYVSCSELTSLKGLLKPIYSGQIVCVLEQIIVCQEWLKYPFLFDQSAAVLKV